MKYLLDTCVISELVKPKPEPTVLKWIAAQSEEHLYLSVLTFGEIEKGIAKLNDPKRALKLQGWTEDLRRRFDGRWLEVTWEVARKWGQIQGANEKRGRQAPVIDGLLAATALTFDCCFVTRNVDDFATSGVTVFNPWKINSQPEGPSES